MRFSTHGNGNGLDDLYVMPESTEDREKIKEVVKQARDAGEIWPKNGHWCRSDVPESDWYGRMFYEIPFGESLRARFEQ